MTTSPANPTADGAPRPGASRAFGVRPIAALGGLDPYSTPRSPTPAPLRLDGNEGAAAPDELRAIFAGLDPELARRYPDVSSLERLLAARLGVEPERVVATAGADDALDRLMRAVLAPGRTLVCPLPTFVMIPRGPALTGAELVAPDWPAGEPFPTDEVLARTDDRTAAIAVVSPNNPHGGVADPADIVRIARSAPHALVIADLAYVEFADADPSAELLAEPNVAVVRTLSKAWGLAGLRVGYCAADPRVIRWMRAAGGPYAVSGVSAAVAAARLAEPENRVRGFVSRVRDERNRTETLLREVAGPTATVGRSMGNFAFVESRWAGVWRDLIAGMGVAVRAFPPSDRSPGALRITMPGDNHAFATLEHALRTVFEPEALLLDMDGVIADVSRSYRRAITGTARTFGVEVSAGDIAAAKRAGGANNDWELTTALLRARGVDADLADVTERFERLYQGQDAEPGLWTTETLIGDRDRYARLADRLPLAVVTGRPRRDAQRFLEQENLADLFSAVVCMEDAPAKPDPAPLLRAIEALGVGRTWMVGDTVDDCRAARAAGSLPIGVLPPGVSDDDDADAAALLAAGAGRVAENLQQIEEWLRWA